MKAATSLLVPAVALLAYLTSPSPAQDTDTPPVETAAELSPAWVDQYAALLKKYVTPSGVRYQAWHGSAADRAALGSVVAAIGEADLTGKSEAGRLAFYLNAYNAWILHRILDEYPTEGPGGGGFFGRNRFFHADSIKVAGQTTSFDDLENEVIRPTFNEPRIHFALNCASTSCPPLHTEPFRSATLDATLDGLTKAFVNKNPNGLKTTGGGEVEVSKIFDWYGADFEAAGGVLAFINQFRDQPLPAGTRVSFQDYRWTLNEAR